MGQETYTKKINKLDDIAQNYVGYYVMKLTFPLKGWGKLSIKFSMDF